MTAKRMPRILIIGAGGIGGLTLDLVVPALDGRRRCSMGSMVRRAAELSN